MTQIMINELPQLTELQEEEQNQVYGGVSAAASAAANYSSATAASVSSGNRPVMTFSLSVRESDWYWYGYEFIRVSSEAFTF
ncbi:MAG: hypothetical protein EA365_11480 [Gloeocapsa sp. DLM2.Bin57]|nr:MAG: hypothetical protein EA365_11480 [Gloeocapsa sp. DLM2.Bin57]